MRSLYISMIVFSCINMSIRAVIEGSNPHYRPKQETAEEREERLRKEQFHQDLALNAAPAAVHAGIQASATLLRPALEKYPKETLMFFTAASGVLTYAAFEYTESKYSRLMTSLLTTFLGYLTLTEWRKQRAEEGRQKRLEELKKRELREQEQWARYERERKRKRYHHPDRPYHTT